jgi:hypothetical protein
VVGLFTGHCHLKGHLFKLGFTDDPICERCLEEDESAGMIMARKLGVENNGQISENTPL